MGNHLPKSFTRKHGNALKRHYSGNAKHFKATQNSNSPKLILKQKSIQYYVDRMKYSCFQSVWPVLGIDPEVWYKTMQMHWKCYSGAGKHFKATQNSKSPKLILKPKSFQYYVDRMKYSCFRSVWLVLGIHPEVLYKLCKCIENTTQVLESNLKQKQN